MISIMNILLFILYNVLFFISLVLIIRYLIFCLSVRRENVFDLKPAVISLVIVVCGYGWAYFASNTPATCIEDKTFDISKETATDGRYFQYYMNGEKIVNVTRIFSEVYPYGYKINVKVYNNWRLGIYFYGDPTYIFTILDLDNKVVETASE